MKYTCDKYCVYCGKTVIAHTYVSDDTHRRGTTKPHIEVRILQGMPRDETIKKIIKDCPEFVEETGINENYYPRLFGAPKKKTRKNKQLSIVII